MRIFIATWIIGVLTLSCPWAAAAVLTEPLPPKTLGELDERLSLIFKKIGVPGASVALIENGQVVLAKGYGVSDVAAGTPVTPETVFRAGSISKCFIGVSVMMLVEEGKLDLNARLSDLVPEITFVNKWEASDPVRLVHLLEHTSGFDNLRFSQYLFEATDSSLKTAVGLYGPYVSRWRPGTLVSYSNAAPVIAAYIVEKTSGQSWEDFTRARIFEPLGMGSAHWDRSPEIAGLLSRGYKADGKTERPYMDILGRPVGALNVSPRDLAKFAIMLSERGAVGGRALLTPESVNRIEAPKSSLASRLGLAFGYGLGNLAFPSEKSVFHGHDGGINGFIASFRYEPTRKTGYVLMINAPKSDVAEAAELLTAYLERNWPKPGFPDTEPNSEESKGLAGVYQTNSPGLEMLRPLELLFDWTPVKSRDGRLVISDVERVPLGNGVFRRIDRAGPSMIFARTSSGPQMLTYLGSSRRVSWSHLFGQVGSRFKVHSGC